MPEIKHVFNQGKMNKDLDERLVPNGEYRHALNIQVSSSDGSDVGTVQNLLGNNKLSNFVGLNSKCVGAISDDKNNAFYWFIKSQYIDSIVEYKNGIITPVIVDINQNVLKFTDNIITGINIIDNLLFWTDNYNEPKKINIDICKQGTDINGYTHTKLVVSERLISANDYIDIREEHITVIKKSPKKQLTLNISANNTVEGSADLEFMDANSNQYVEGDTFQIIGMNLPAGSSFAEGSVVLVLASTSTGSLPEDYDIRLEVVENISGKQGESMPGIQPLPYPPHSYWFKVLSTSQNITTNLKLYYFQQGGNDEKFFEDKFVRFSYRYKYQDGEYSCYAPFSELAFVPDQFNYDTKKAYNTGMDNYLSELVISGFVETDILENVVEIEIVYKESNSPLVYSVDKITKTDFDNTEYINAGGAVVISNYWNSNRYKITSDIIYAVLPENQLARPFDNVPKKALAQEITGNRLVYGNYEQNYNLPKALISAWNKPRYDVQFEDLLPKKSLKSSRQYQLGVTYLDDYGRETSVFTNPKATFKVPKIQAGSYNSIATKFTTDHPTWAKGFKFYVKETAGEFYNLALDRVYEAEDGNLWLSFPSSERNKIDEETFLVLKKAVEGSTVISEEAKYKVIAIENQAPIFIKTLKKELLRTNGNSLGSINNADGVVVPIAEFFFEYQTPQVNSREFLIRKETWLTAINDVELVDLTEIAEPISITFADLGANRFSKEYKIANITTDKEDAAAAYNVILDDVIDESDAWIYPDLVDPDASTAVTNNTGFSTSLTIIIHKFEIENRPEFEGRFFTKIYSDEIARQYIFLPSLDEKNYETLAACQAYYFSDTSAANMNGATGTTSLRDDGVTVFNGDTTSEGIQLIQYNINTNKYSVIDQPFAQTPTGSNQFPTSDETEWQALLDIDGDGASDANFFIDQVYFRGEAPLNFFEASSDRDSGTLDTTSVEKHGLTLVHGYQGSTPHVEMDFDWAPAVTDSLIRKYASENGGDTFNQGIYEENGQWYIELAFSTLSRNEIVNEFIPNSQGGMDETQVSYNPQLPGGIHSQGLYQDAIWQVDEIHTKFVANLKSGTVFTFEGDANKAFYKITDNPQIFRRYNHTSAFDWWYAHCNYLATGTGGNNTQISQARNEAAQQFNKFIASDNRRVTYKIPISVFNKERGEITGEDVLGASDFSSTGALQGLLSTATENAPVRITFLKERFDPSTRLATDKPAIFETMPKETAELDIYYEASQVFPTFLNNKTLGTIVEKGMKITCDRVGVITEETEVLLITNNSIKFSNAMTDEVLQVGDVFTFTGKDGSFVKLKFSAFASSTFLTPVGQQNGFNVSEYLVFNEIYNEYGLSWFNCYSFGNGVESNRIRDGFNQVTIDKGVKVSAPVEDVYKQERRLNGLIYSGIYNSTSGVNNLNQFIQAEKITKDLNPTYGSVQKLFSRNTDLIAFCEDRVIKILANKDAVFNADGNPNLTATNKVLGQAMPFAGDYGISKNPESFAKENYRAYFSDKQRGAVLRLSMDGLTPISEYGMSDYFSDNLKLNNILLGSFDGDKNEYNLTLDSTNVTVSFDEKVKGWTSFKSFVPEQGISMSNDYYTFKNAQVYKHHVEQDNSQNPIARNNFYGDQYISSVEVLLNEQPSIIKRYKTLNYEGTDSKVIKEVTNVNSGYHNLEDKPGWFSTYIKTNENEGYVSEFIKKEGKWFNFIKGNDFVNNQQIDTKMFTYQGLGRIVNLEIDLTLHQQSITPPPPPIPDPITGTVGCMDPNATNYDPAATINDITLCSYVAPPPPPPPPASIPGCTDPTALNYDPLATYDDGTCTYPPPPPIPGCTNPDAINYDPMATADDGSCVLPELYIEDIADDDITGNPNV